MFPELRERIGSLFRESKLTTLDLKSAPGIGADWYARNGFNNLAALHEYGPSWSGPTVTVDTAQNHSVVWACERIISESIAFMPLAMMQETSRGKFPANGSEAPAHPMYLALHNAPNDEMTAMGFRETETAHVVMGGNCFGRIMRRSGTGVANELYPLLPTQVTPDRDREKRLVYVVKDGNAQSQTYTVERGRPHDILHIRGLGNDGVRGYSVITMARHSLGTAIAAEHNVARFFARGGRLPYVLQMEGRFKSDEDFKRFRADWEETYEDPHKAPILEPPIKDYKPIGLSARDAQLLETRQFEIPEICRWFLISPHLVGDLSRATFCLPGESEVFTISGPKRIDSITPGEIVWSRPDSGWVQSRVAHSVCTGHDKILTIKTTNRTIRLNARHRVLARRSRLVSNGQKASIGQHPIAWSTEWVPAGDLRVGDTIVNLSSLPVTGVDVIPSGRPASEGFLEFCGLLLGDGNVSKANGSLVGVQIARASDAPYMDHYRQIMRAMFTACKNAGPLTYERQEQREIHLNEQDRQTRFKSRRAAEELESLGLGGTAKTKRVPGWVFGMSERYRLALLRGFLDADGSVDKKGRISFSSCNRHLLSGIRHLCMGVGVPVTNLRLQEGMTTLPNGERFPIHQYAFTCSDPACNRRIGSHTPEYVRRMESGKPFSRKSRNYPQYGGKGFEMLGCELARIASIEESAICEPVYDLEVEGTHSFIADGVVVHNSNIEHLALQFVKFTLTAWTTRWEQELWRCILTPEEKRQGYYFKHNVNGLLRGDFQTRMAGYASALQNGHLSVNEVRDLEDRNPVDGGDQHVVQLNMQELTAVGEPAATRVPVAGRKPQAAA